MIFVLGCCTATFHFPGMGRYATGLVPDVAVQLPHAQRLVLLCNEADISISVLHESHAKCANATEAVYRSVLEQAL